MKAVLEFPNLLILGLRLRGRLVQFTVVGLLIPWQSLDMPIQVADFNTQPFPFPPLKYFFNYSDWHNESLECTYK